MVEINRGIETAAFRASVKNAVHIFHNRIINGMNKEAMIVTHKPISLNYINQSPGSDLLEKMLTEWVVINLKLDGLK